MTRCSPRGPRGRLQILSAILAIAAVWCVDALAGSFGVAPMRLDFRADERSALVTVDNDGDEKVTYQATLAEWSQAPDGVDQYAESKDLIFFPRIFAIEPHGKRILRVGVKGLPPPSEKAYRLYIGEMPAPEKKKEAGPAHVNVVLRFGVPVFVAPAQPRREFAMDEPQIARGKVRVTIRNLGNQSAKFETLDVMRGKDVVAEVIGWYVLPGAARTFEIPVDAAKCVGSGTLEVVANAEGNVLKRAFKAAPALCERS